jgi:hypothetical protein
MTDIGAKRPRAVGCGPFFTRLPLASNSVSHVGRYENGIRHMGPFFERGREQWAEGSSISISDSVRI